jgi:hypothetical protein
MGCQDLISGDSTNENIPRKSTEKTTSNPRGMISRLNSFLDSAK